MYNMTHYEPPIAHYAHINMSEFTNEQLKKIIGVNGKRLYAITTRYNLKYVWMDFTNKRLELWGSYNAFLKGARQNIQKEILKTIV